MCEICTNSIVKSALLYGSNTWRTTKTKSQKLEPFINSCPPQHQMAGSDFKQSLWEGNEHASHHRDQEKEME
jgi:hypothetical protein